MKWEKLSRKEITKRIESALEENASYTKSGLMGVPTTYLDKDEFYPDASFLKDAPYLRSLIANPNHIGCHTLSKQSPSLYEGTQDIEKELIHLCAEEIFSAKKNSVDGYVASGGSEANIEALWIYRNYFNKEYNAKTNQVAVIYSEDSHYSITKGCDLLQLQEILLPVEFENRQINDDELQKKVLEAKANGIKYFIVILNVATRMYGSIDLVNPIVKVLEEEKVLFKVHLDASFGGFIYPFTNPKSIHNFKNPNISSIAIDAQKMLQTPYGTGIFLIRKGYMQYVSNKQAQYIPGLDYTICGSRSGSNAIVIWMLLLSYGSEGWKEKMAKIIERTDYLCNGLDEMGVQYFRNPFMNIVAIKANSIPIELGQKYGLVADTMEHTPSWWKIVVMDHVDYKLLNDFLDEYKGVSMT